MHVHSLFYYLTSPYKASDWQLLYTDALKENNNVVVDENSKSLTMKALSEFSSIFTEERTKT